MNLVERITELHRALADDEIAHAFGGALALAWCTERARGTIDIDVNVFVNVERAESVYDALLPDVSVTEDDRAAIVRDGQTRLWWGETPVDIFFNTTDFHVDAAGQARFEDFAGERVPFLACRDLAVFKACRDRSRDWADLQEMHAAGTLDVEAVLGVLAHCLGAEDARLERLRAFASTAACASLSEPGPGLLSTNSPLYRCSKSGQATADIDLVHEWFAEILGLRIGAGLEEGHNARPVGYVARIADATVDLGVQSEVQERSRELVLPNPMVRVNAMSRQQSEELCSIECVDRIVDLLIALFW